MNWIRVLPHCKVLYLFIGLFAVLLPVSIDLGIGGTFCSAAKIENAKNKFDSGVVLRAVAASSSGTNSPREDTGPAKSSTKAPAMKPSEMGSAKVNDTDGSGKIKCHNGTATCNEGSSTDNDGGFGTFKAITDNSGMLFRAMYVLLGVTGIVVVYFVVRALRLRRKRSKSRKYGIITQHDDGGGMEMEPLGDGDEDDDDYTVFEMNGRKK
ncbi:membrane protein FAM174A [Aplysia californica]|uniref:Membrane protein FAM174A n=1 Tax=Aplysia californica TaxID=6500 RepID=A0ABM0JH09_APLCA|nr:membrane protein FAM174A [Aplysia californica]